MERCLRCQGSKKIAPMGGIYVNCNVCNGLGFITTDRAQELQQAAMKVTCEHIQPLLDECHPENVMDEPMESDLSGVHLLNEKAPEVIRNKPGRKKGWNKQVNAS